MVFVHGLGYGKGMRNSRRMVFYYIEQITDYYIPAGPFILLSNEKLLRLPIVKW